MDLYENIKEVAKNKGYSINLLEKELGYARSSMSKFKKNTPSANKIREIADFLGVSADYLINGSESGFDKFSVDNAKLIAKIAKDQQALRMLDMFMKLSENGKMELEKMAEFKLELENKKE